MPWIVYETTNLKNGKKYVGVHKQDGDGFDGYWGSGKALKAAIRKYGHAFFERRTLEVFESDAKAYAREAEIVTEEWCRRKDTYNQKRGGIGGWKRDDLEIEARRKAALDDPRCRKKQSESARRSWSNPQYREMQCALKRARFTDSHYMEKHIALRKSQWADPQIGERLRASRSSADFREKQSAARAALWKDPAYRERQVSWWMNPDYRARQSASRKAAWVRRRIAKATAMLVVIQDAHVSPQA